jgi:hypothetical protein
VKSGQDFYIDELLTAVNEIDKEIMEIAKIKR